MWGESSHVIWIYAMTWFEDGKIAIWNGCLRGKFDQGVHPDIEINWHCLLGKTMRLIVAVPLKGRSHKGTVSAL